MKKLLLILVCASGCVSAVESDYENEEMKYGELGDVKLLTPAGMTQTLAVGVPVEFSWESDDGRALDFELQIQLVQLNGLDPTLVSQRLRWQVWSHAHGGNNYDYPPNDTATFAPGTPTLRSPGWPIPARGVRARFSGRAAKVGFIARGQFGVDTYAPLIRVSLQPVYGAEVPIVPEVDDRNQGIGAAGAGGTFPMGANEWRVSGIGLLAADSILIYGADGTTLLDTVTAASLTDWQPIPLDALGWGTLGSIQAQAIYR